MLNKETNTQQNLKGELFDKNKSCEFACLIGHEALQQGLVKEPIPGYKYFGSDDRGLPKGIQSEFFYDWRPLLDNPPTECPECDGAGEVKSTYGNSLYSAGYSDHGYTNWDVCPLCKGLKQVSSIVAAQWLGII